MRDRHLRVAKAPEPTGVRRRAALGGPGSHDSRRVVALVAGHPGEAHTEQASDLVGDSREDRLRPGAARDERRNPTQGSLLGGQLAELGTALRVCDRHGNELRELREA